MSSVPQPSAILPARRYRRFYLLALLPVLVGTVGGLTYHEFVLHAILTNIVLNAIILGTATMGVLLMIRTIAGVVQEWRGFARLSAGPLGEEGREKVKPLLGGRLLVHLDELRGGHLSLLDQSHLHEEMNELREALNSRQELGQYLVGLMVALGLLGTFIGLLETLVGVGQLIGSFGGNSGSLDDSFRALLGNLQRPLAAMGTAFAASMFGLIGSLLLGLVQIVVRAAQAAFFDDAHAIANKIAQISEHVAPVPDSPASQAWLVAVVDDMLAAQRDLVDQVSALREESARNDGKIGTLASAVEAMCDGMRILGRSATQHDAALEAVAQVTPQLALLCDAALGIEARLSSSATDFQAWQSDLDRRHAVALRYFGRLARQNARALSFAIDELAQNQHQVLQQIAGDQAQEERRTLRAQAHLLNVVSRLSDLLLRNQAQDDALLQAVRDAIGQGEAGLQEIVRRLDRMFDLVSRAPEPATAPVEIDIVLRRLEELERRMGRDLRTAVAALTRPEEVA